MFGKKIKSEYEEIVQNPEPIADPLRKKRSNITLSSVARLILLGNRRELETSDFGHISEEDETENLTNDLSAKWSWEVKKSKSSLLNALWTTFAPLHYWDFFNLCFLQFVCRMGMLVVLGFLMRILEKEHTPSTVYILVALFLVLSFTSYVGSTVIITRLRSGVVQARIALSGLIHTKALSLSLEESTNAGTAQQTKLITDVLSRFGDGFEFIPYVLIGPIQVLIALAILYTWVGMAPVVGMFLLIILIVIQNSLGALVGRLGKKTAKATDERIRVILELLNSISLIKMFTWEDVYLKKISEKREEEAESVRTKSILRAMMLSLSTITRPLPILASLAAFTVLGNELTADAVYLNNSTYAIMSFTVGYQIPIGFTSLVQLLISIKKVEEFLNIENMMQTELAAHAPAAMNIKLDPELKTASLVVQNLTVKYTNNQAPVFEHLNFSAKYGQLVGIVGAIGSGKSSLMLSILSEIPIESGEVKLTGSTAYISQQPWLFPGTIRENITFGSDYEPKWYAKVLAACALTCDLQEFAFRDMTLVGTKGSRLSGGQQARIHLARGVYANADIYILDDVLSSVDVKVARSIFTECISGILKDKCVLFATHQTNFLTEATKIVQLTQSYPFTNASLSEEVQLNVDDLVADEKQWQLDYTKSEPSEFVHFNLEQPTSKERSTGGIGLAGLTEYITAGNSIPRFLWTILVIIIMKCVTAYSDIFLKEWIDWEQGSSEFSTTRLHYIGIYTTLVLVTLILAFYGCTALSLNLLSSSKALHNLLTNAIIRAPIRFLQINGTGRVLNRFLSDISVLDEMIQPLAFIVLTLFTELIGSAVIVGLMLPLTVFPAIVVHLLGFLLIWVYLNPAATTKHLEGVTRSPIIDLFESSLAGLPTIHAYKRNNYFTKKFQDLQGVHSAIGITSIYMSGWIRLMIDLLVHIYVFIVLAVFLFTSNS